VEIQRDQPSLSISGCVEKKQFNAIFIAPTGNFLNLTAELIERRVAITPIPLGFDLPSAGIPTWRYPP
jgi:hypothetical protein